LQFLWTGRSVPIATGMVAVATLAVGSHNIALQVSDGLAATTDLITIDILSGAHTVQELSDMLISSALARKSLPPLLATVKAAGDAVERGSTGAAINQLRAFQNKVRAQIAPSDPAFAADLIELAQRIIDSIDATPGPRVAIQAVNGGRATQLRFSGNVA